MVVVIKKKGESKDSLFRKFTRTFLDEEILEKVKEGQYFKKPSQVRKEKEKERKKGKRIKRVGQRW